MTILYVYKVELYAGLPQDLSSLHYFGPEVSFHVHYIQESHQLIFRTCPRALKASTWMMVILGQQEGAEDQEVMSQPDRER